MTTPIATDDTTDVVWRDLILLALLGMTACVVLMLAWIAEGKKATSEVTSPGAVMVEAVWPEGNPSDVDLWVQAPGDTPVGYSNKGGVVFNLLRDDLGDFADILPSNYEHAYARAIVPGEYTVNLHVYRAKGSMPFEATVQVSIRHPQYTTKLLQTKVTLRREGEERTAFRFKLTEDGALVPGSVHAAFKALRSGVK
jgi:hypothetical protein